MTDAVPLVTVGIPVRNGAGVIEFVLENLIRSSYPREALEVIVGNHDSTDSTADIVRSFENRLNVSLVEVDSAIDKSRSAVRNRILERASGDVIIFIDADVLVCDDFVRAHAELHRETDGLVSGYTFGKSAVTELKDDSRLLTELKTTHISTKFDLLQGTDALRDYRDMMPVMRDDPALVPLNQRSYAWRGFWSCNMSMRRTELLSIGGFDESFIGWGMEDEELAYRCVLNGKKLTFSRRAWGYHVPHPVDTDRNIAEARDNVERFFRKYQNGEIEQLCYNLAEHGSMNGNLRDPASPSEVEFMRQVGEVAARLSSCSGTRLGICIQNDMAAQRLNLTRCFLPYISYRITPHLKQGCTFYSLLGVKSPFGGEEIDEAIVFVDVLMFFNESRIRAVLREVARVAKRRILVCGPLYREPGRQTLRARFDRCLGTTTAEYLQV